MLSDYIPEIKTKDSSVTNANLEQGKTFRKIKSLSYLYEIDQTGRIVRNVKSKKQLRQHLNNQGYYLVTVCIKGHPRHVTVHSLVAECWLGEKPDGYEIDHIDKDKINNCYTNLRYVTHSENNLNRNMPWKRSVEISDGKNNFFFETMGQCAYFIAEKYNKTYKSIRFKLSKRRHHIFDYDIKYLPCAETASNHSTE